MGKETGKQLPEGVHPGPGKSEKPGEGLDARTRPGQQRATTAQRKSGASKNGKLSDKPGYLDRAKLFDQGVIGDSARKEDGRRTKEKG